MTKLITYLSFLTVRSAGTSSGSGSMFGGPARPRPSAPPAAPARPAAPAHAPPAAPAAPAHPTAPAVPAAPSYAPAPAPSSGGGGFMSTMASGLAFGTGSAIAHQAVGGITRSLFGGSSDKAEAAPAPAAAPAQAPADSYYVGSRPQPQACDEMKRMFDECLSRNRADLSMCQSHFDQFQECQLRYN